MNIKDIIIRIHGDVLGQDYDNYILNKNILNKYYNIINIDVNRVVTDTGWCKRLLLDLKLLKPTCFNVIIECHMGLGSVYGCEEYILISKNNNQYNYISVSNMIYLLQLLNTKIKLLVVCCYGGAFKNYIRKLPRGSLIISFVDLTTLLLDPLFHDKFKNINFQNYLYKAGFNLYKILTIYLVKNNMTLGTNFKIIKSNFNYNIKKGINRLHNIKRFFKNDFILKLIDFNIINKEQLHYLIKNYKEQKKLIYYTKYDLLIDKEKGNYDQVINKYKKYFLPTINTAIDEIWLNECFNLDKEEDEDEDYDEDDKNKLINPLWYLCGYANSGTKGENTQDDLIPYISYIQALVIVKRFIIIKKRKLKQYNRKACFSSLQEELRHTKIMQRYNSTCDTPKDEEIFPN
jgi:hypothetical protein